MQIGSAFLTPIMISTQLRSVLSSQKTAPRYRMVRVTSAKDGRAMNKPGSEKEPGPGQCNTRPLLVNVNAMPPFVAS